MIDTLDQSTLESASSRQPLVQAFATHRPPVDDGRQERDLLRTAQERFRVASDYESKWRTRAKEELDFLALKHWSEEQLAERRGRPCLTFDRISPSVNMVINDARQSPPEPRISPVGNGADKDTAEVLMGHIRNIEQDSSADIAYMQAYGDAVKIGRGWFRIASEYEANDIDFDADDPLNNPDLFRQKLKVVRIPNTFSIYVDPSAQEFDLRDMRWIFQVEDVDREVYKAQYPESRVAGLSSFEGIGDPIRWFPNGGVRVAEYWWLEETPVDIAILQGGRIVPVDQVYDGRVLSRRRIMQRRIFGAKINGAEVLEQWEWPGRYIPFIPVLGEEVILDGKRTLRGMVRAAMDANLNYDYMRSKMAEAVGLAPLAPWRVAVGSIEGFEQQWETINRVSRAFVYYRSSVNGEPVPPPARDMAEPAIGAIVQAVMHADNDIKATLSTYDASLGNAGPESSGRAIMARQREADNAHFHFHDNLSRSIRHCGRILLDLIPHYYADERAITICDPDGTVRSVEINKPTIVEQVEKVFHLGNRAARYDVTVQSGPSFPARRQEGQQAMIELTRTVPNAMGRALDLVVRSMDFPGANELAERLRPPDIAAQQGGDMPIPPHIQQQLAQQQALLQVLTQKLAQAQDSSERERIRSATSERNNARDNETRLKLGLLESGNQAALAQLDAELAEIRRRYTELNSSPQTANPSPEGGEPTAPGQTPPMAPPQAPQQPQPAGAPQHPQVLPQ